MIQLKNLQVGQLSFFVLDLQKYVFLDVFKLYEMDIYMCVYQ